VDGDWTKAREQLEQATQVHPDFIGGLSLLVTVREHDADAAGAEQLRATIGKREFTDFADPWRDALFDDCFEPYLLSVAASKANFAGDRTAAHRWLERAIRFAPHPGTYHRQLGKMLLETSDFARAWANLEKAVALEPTDSEAWSIMVFASTTMGDMARADKALAAGLAHCPQSAALHHSYGQRLASLGRQQEAIREFALAKKLRPNEANAYISLALMYFRTGQVEPAVAELKAALLVQPGHPLALSTLARYSTDTGDEPAARHWIRQLRLQPRVPAADLNTVIGAYQQKFGRAPW
jgi:Flp pilus assembly protein TadD